MKDRPTGTVTFLFTDLEGSTQRWEEEPAAMPAVLARHDEILRTEIDRRGGLLFASTGEGCAAAFADADDAVASAVEIQRRLSAELPTGGPALAVRMGLYSGEAVQHDGGYAGPVPNRAARIMAAGHGGQILVGAPTVELLGDVELVDLGEHRLKDLAGTEHVFQVCAGGLRTDFPALRSVDARRGNVPMPPTALVGRAWELDEIAGLTQSHRLVTLTGVGGVGKTRLALEAAGALAERFPDGVWFAELAAVADPSAVPDAIATALGVTPQAGVPLTQTLAEALSGRRLLLILDNCEHVVDAAAAVAEVILARAGTVTMLATSREGLRVAGEQLMAVPPMALDGGAASAAVALFTERARSVNPSFELEEGTTAEAVTEICRGLDGLALGIELAAAWMASPSAVDLHDRLVADRFRLLTGSKRQRSLRETVGWSYHLLDDDERTVLMHVSAFSGGFSLDAVVDVLPDTDPLDVLAHLDSLVRKSLVTTAQAGGAVRYGLLETIRAFAEDQLADLGALEAARDRHAAHFARGVTERWRHWHGPGFGDAVDWVTAEFANLRSAFRWAAERDDVDTAVDIAAHTAMIGVSTELLEAIGWVEAVIEAATAADVRRLPRAYTAAGYSCFTGSPELAVARAQSAQRLEADDRYDPFEPAWSTFIEALAQVYCGRVDRYVELTRQVTDVGGPALAYGLPALVDGLQATGLVTEAEELIEGAVDAARHRGNPWLIAYALWIRGSVYAHHEPARAVTLWREALEYVRTHRITFFEGFIARDAALLQVVDAVPSESLDLFDTAIDSFRRSGNVAQLTITVASLMALFEAVERPEVAATLYGAITGPVGGDHHVRDLPDLADRIGSKLGPDSWAACTATGATMDLTATALYASDQIQLARLSVDRPRIDDPPVADLSKREVEVLRLITEGCTTREIADRLYISPKTADHHIQHIYTKIGVSNRAGATLWAFQRAVVE